MDSNQEANMTSNLRAEQDKLAAQELVRRNHINAIATQIYVQEVGKLHGVAGGDAQLGDLIRFSVGAAVAFARSVLGYDVQVVQAAQSVQQAPTK
jgi:hypothetical protein